MKTKQKIELTVVILTMIFVTILGVGAHIAYSAEKPIKLAMKHPTALSQVNQPKLSASGVATWTNIAHAKNYHVQLYHNAEAQGAPVTVASGKKGIIFSLL